MILTSGAACDIRTTLNTRWRFKMKKTSGLVIVLLAGLILSAGCGPKDRSAKIVCEMNGKNVKTVFTQDGFLDTLQKEHGKVQFERDAFMKSESVEVYFRKLDDGNLLAEKVVVVKTGKTVEPAFFFGLTK
jgi:hypothetical protein